MTLFLATSLFLTNPAPLEMPRAEGYLVREQKATRLEDRFVRLDLWTSQAVDGRWRDDAGREFLLATLAVRPPPVEAGATETRAQFAASRIPVSHRKPEQVREAVARLSLVEVAEKPSRPRQLPRGYADVDYWQGTNETALVCAFRRRETNVWRLVTWTLAEGDDPDAMRQALEDEFLVRELSELDAKTAAAGDWGQALPPAAKAARPGGRRREPLPTEDALLRADARHSVAAYANWRATDAANYTILDDLTGSRDFVASLTNELVAAHRAYVAALPTPLDTTNALCVARLFATREEYLDALEAEDRADMAWSAAYWNPAKRELVAYLPTGGERELLRTIRHEAFHQYLSYATALLPTSPWLNEGYAQFFEDPDSRAWGSGFDTSPDGLKRLAADLPSVFPLDYAAFYAGTDDERRLKYRLAWSVAVFLEKGAPDVRFRPFQDVKRNYVETLLATQDPAKATAAAFGGEETFRLFCREWLAWWRENAASGVRKLP